MASHRLLKGFEVERFTGRRDGTVVGCSAEAARALAGFVVEPDHRNLEYITPPEADYGRQLALLLEPRRRLRPWLAERGLTLLPGSTLSLGDSSRFERSDPDHPYHAYIEATYGTRVVTASVHINLGLTPGTPFQGQDALFAGLRLLRCEAALLLALSASSPFLDGRVTGAHSQRWLQFPLTPAEVPLFADHQHYVSWMQAELAAGRMQNVRHLWTSVRPNGDDRPHDLNRLEIRICDLVSDPLLLLAITAFAELRLLQLMQAPEQGDPLRASSLSAMELARLADANDQSSARSSLEAQLNHWRDGRAISCRRWIEDSLEQLVPLARQEQLEVLLEPLERVLREGNQAMRWLARHRSGESIASILSAEAAAMADQEERLSAAAPRGDWPSATDHTDHQAGVLG
ncbi:glutamate--cysteine ligase [Cyanobium sp. CH-040]|uniref:glutamate--cysteine ligase n=1 Tax=Cyanobium sp. CH-040 TaxID=2823708 RepID=UPI0020CFC547|nr:glutamate--cysteine ligase [Cyanobium sp. CH-040]MCP9929018.1 glutamate--cysteine ligase [Cyanobium sp. CH-040]